MDQTQLSTPGRPIVYSGNNNKKQIFFVTVFVDSVSKKVFCEFQHSTDSEETIKAKRAMQRNAKTCGVKIKAFRVDNGIFKSAQFRLELKIRTKRFFILWSWSSSPKRCCRKLHTYVLW